MSANGWRLACLIVCSTSSIQSACSYVLVERAPPEPVRSSSNACTESDALPVADTLIAASFAAALVAGLVPWSHPQPVAHDWGFGEIGETIARVTVAVLGGIGAIAYSTSAIYGYRAVSQCRQIRFARTTRGNDRAEEGGSEVFVRRASAVRTSSDSEEAASLRGATLVATEEGGRVVVAAAARGSPADLAGIRPGDVILEIAVAAQGGAFRRVTFESVEDLRALDSGARPVIVKVARGEETRTLIIDAIARRPPGERLPSDEGKK
jgi:hypothetical protein